MLSANLIAPCGHRSVSTDAQRGVGGGSTLVDWDAALLLSDLLMRAKMASSL